jgi:hypothetical protein
MKPIDKKSMKAAFEELDRRSKKSFQLIMGGGGAMIAAHNYALATSDVDAITKGIEFVEIEDLVKEIARLQNLPPDWLNSHFSTFVFTLPSDYETRLIEVFSGNKLKVKALGREDMLVLKCFAHRTKDLGHAKNLIKSGANIKFVEAHIESLAKNKIPQAPEALDFLDQLKDELGIE